MFPHHLTNKVKKEMRKLSAIQLILKTSNSGLDCKWHKVSALKTTVNMQIIYGYGHQ